jgi:hypothetical protein
MKVENRSELPALTVLKKILFISVNNIFYKKLLKKKDFDGKL